MHSLPKLLARFASAGAIGVIVFNFVLWFLTDYQKVWYPLSAFCAGTIVTLVSFAIHKFWTFKNKDRTRARQQLFQYAIMNVSFMIGGPLLLYLLVEYAGLWYLLGQALITCLFSAISWFVTNKIFKE